MQYNLEKAEHPYFNNSLELFKWNQNKGIKYTKDIIKKNKDEIIKKNFNLSGIKSLYQKCSFDNYKVECVGQQIALDRAKEYAKDFEKNISNFIFSGFPGTGKNHLASAIGRDLILRGKKFLIITVSDLMSKIKSTFKKNTERKLINKLSNLDLLVIDEIGIQIESRYEKNILNQIVDRRSSANFKTGILSNLDIIGLTDLLGERVIDRMRLGKGFWVCFNWESYRSRVDNKI